MKAFTNNYADIPFFISSNTFTGDLNVVRNLSAVRQSIKNIILTNIGERPFDYAFGCNIYGSLFENNSAEFRIFLQNRIQSAIAEYESRVLIRDLRTEFDPTLPNTVTLYLSYILAEEGIQDEIDIQITRNR